MFEITSLLVLNDRLIIRVDHESFKDDLSSGVTTVSTTYPSSNNLKFEMATDTLIQLIDQLEANQYQLEKVDELDMLEPSNCIYILCEKLINYQMWSLDILGSEFNLQSMFNLSINLFNNNLIRIVGDCWVSYELDLLNQQSEIDYSSVMNKICQIKSQQFSFSPRLNSFQTDLISIDKLRHSKPAPPYRFGINRSITNGNGYGYGNDENDDGIMNAEPAFKVVTSRVSLKQREVSCLIGKNGDRLNALRYESKCLIKVLPIASLDSNSTVTALTTTATPNFQRVTTTTLSISRRDILQSILIRGYQSNVDHALKSIQNIIVNYRNSDSKFI
ncbi:hypothetical protein DFJ63DRAFT_118686 [Scheffersomyces coipomensis]|uniref:uncharacterized protein n=1 Tax=Scheffersomyces coipomensis TaxID=1788519 RepID=UPI00315D313E